MNSSIRKVIPIAGLLIPVIGFTGCDGDTAQLIEEINAAREGCNEEALKSSSEECVQMFERYAEMGEDAMETYIGGMRAFETAIERHGGVNFDTTGLGRAITIQESAPEPGTAASRSTRTSNDALSDFRGQPEWVRENAQAQRTGDGWSGVDLYDRSGGSRPSGRREPVPLNDRRPEEPYTRSGDPAASGPDRRGAIRPPADRLRRPWLDGDGSSAPYYDEPTTSDVRSREERPVPDRWSDPQSAPYPRE